MPRRDRTYSDKDVLRIYDYYLTEEERLVVRKAILQEPVDEDLLWPTEVCFLLDEVLEFGIYAISLSLKIWETSKITGGFADQLVILGETLGWIPGVGSRIEELTRFAGERLWDFDQKNYKRLTTIEEYFNKLEGYVNWKCHQR